MVLSLVVDHFHVDVCIGVVNRGRPIEGIIAVVRDLPFVIGPSSQVARLVVLILGQTGIRTGSLGALAKAVVLIAGGESIGIGHLGQIALVIVVEADLMTIGIGSADYPIQGVVMALCGALLGIDGTDDLAECIVFEAGGVVDAIGQGGQQV